MKSVGVIAMMCGLAAVGVAAAQGSADAEILRLRESAWHAWFGGDEAALRRILPADFIGISTGPGPLATLEKVIEDSRAFKAKGGRLVKVEFPETLFQRYGDVVILYGRYVTVVETGGSRQSSQGRLTEMFLKRDGRWVHTGWHLDAVAPPGEAAEQVPGPFSAGPESAGRVPA